MKRRDFIQHTSASAAFLSLGGFSLSSCTPENTAKHITILHTNDVHSHIDVLPDNDPRNPGKGGVSRRATLIERIRRENPNTLLLDAGDIFQGTPYFNYYGGELEFKLMSMLRYDAATLGNHDFDNGIDGLYAQLPHADFDFIIANYDFSDTVMDTHTRPYKVFTRDGIKIGVFGLGIQLKGLVNDNLYKETKYLDPVEIAQDMSTVLKRDENCDVVVCLSHIGYRYRDNNRPSDIMLAENTENIDIIIGGHTHTFLDRPTICHNRKGEKVLVNQAGCFGINVGRIDFYLDHDNKLIDREGRTIIV
ncbi:bifunctional metallophosphatase/5'-nucleotidase [Sinomicrobium soli]|uniref:bifunctional metallophosphatase/5'-nucleotidase n=1 Tax=Sinomicrobium sp. N-1-3-6 TaxID=2219864 RepID=UPI000DCB4F9C|nr:metallophosphatase [Sinomicrobium sp. N-1-3-6]RAV30041.1 bifunctional metallophosphatase/5'-nucleotidase [Sinomicrobium sp. N-1-3-6]